MKYEEFLAEQDAIDAERIIDPRDDEDDAPVGDVLVASRVVRRAGYTIVERKAYADRQDELKRLRKIEERLRRYATHVSGSDSGIYAKVGRELTEILDGGEGE